MSSDRALSFDTVAEEYDRVRPSYPDELVERACARAGLGPGSRVLEVGCGTGKLTVELVARRLDVDAVDPGENLLRVARARVGDAVRFHHGRFEDVDLRGDYEALFSATAFHWIDPELGWSKAARLLRPGGVLALLSHVAGSVLDLEEAFRAAWREARPDATQWFQRGAAETWAGAEARRGNVSALWAWFERREDFSPEAAVLFGDVQIDTVLIDIEETSEAFIALLRTQSAYLTLDAPRRTRLEARIAAAIEEAGGMVRSRIYAVLVTARRAE